jgi:hypothetical protein
MSAHNNMNPGGLNPDDKVTMTVAELDRLLQEKDQQIEMYRAMSTIQSDLSTTSCDSPAPVQTAVMTRDVWISFVYLVTLMRDGEGEDYRAALEIGRTDPIPLRLSQDEIDELNSAIWRWFRCDRVTVLHFILPRSLAPTRGGESTVRTGLTYQPDRRLHVEVQERIFQQVPVSDFPDAAHAGSLPLLSPWEAFKVSLTRIIGLEPGVEASSILEQQSGKHPADSFRSPSYKRGRVDTSNLYPSYIPHEAQRYNSYY